MKTKQLIGMTRDTIGKRRLTAHKSGISFPRFRLLHVSEEGRICHDSAKGRLAAGDVTIAVRVYRPSSLMQACCAATTRDDGSALPFYILTLRKLQRGCTLEFQGGFIRE